MIRWGPRLSMPYHCLSQPLMVGESWFESAPNTPVVVGCGTQCQHRETAWPRVLCRTKVGTYICHSGRGLGEGHARTVGVMRTVYLNVGRRLASCPSTPSLAPKEGSKKRAGEMFLGTSSGPGLFRSRITPCVFGFSK